MTKYVRDILACSVLGALASMAGSVTVQAKAGGVTLSNSVLVQHKSAAADGTTRIALVPAKRVVPGDHVVFRIAYRNGTGQPVSGMIVSNPVPANLAYRGPAEGSPAPQVSADGIHFAAISSLMLAGRPVRADEVRAVRWVVNGTVPSGGSGQYSYEATIK
jgi:uncharacterized repeat protein (TIGR01451 family)